MSKKILIVEDDALMLEVLAYILSSNGYEVRTLAGGSEVFNQIKNNRPDLIIVDADLPGINSRDICRLIKLNKTTSDLRVIMCASDDDPIESILNQNGSPDDVLEKPFDIKSLIQKVEFQFAA
ncbi:MAG TPA: response regulator [Mucilaginibacter sp.]|jgi:DNA-binding response OmpR family regulator|nr:response regulator [Mucilaginibacter sp.]